VRSRIALALLVVAAALPARGRAVTVVCDADACAEIRPGAVVLRTATAERRWRPDRLVTTALADRRAGGLIFARPHPDLALLLDGLRLASDRMRVEGVAARRLPRGGVAVTFDLRLGGLLRVERTVEAYPGIAGFSSRTVLVPATPIVLSGYALDEVAVGRAAATLHAFRAGADWREPGWRPAISVGEAHTGDWRETRAAPAGAPLAGPGEWLSLAAGDRTVFLVMERRDLPSSRMAYDGAVGRALVDLSRDVASLGPFEESVHVENPGPGPARHRALLPGRPVELERVFTGFGADADDEPWQFHRFLVGHRMPPYPRAVTFNTNPVDADRISTGAKDDVDFARFRSLAAAAREMGVETFVFDDGWQAASGDWCPDSPPCPEPRAPRFAPRFPDDEFRAVREVLAGDPRDPSDDMALGLWMSPMEFHPASRAFRRSPTWACAPVGLATAALNAAQPNDGSNEAGIGIWNPEAVGVHPDTGAPTRLIDYIEGRIRRAIDVYGARYFKFDFLVWVDCLGPGTVDLYGYRDAFVAMLDRLLADHPEVTLQIDETNDYRLFPFESVARGPTWFRNGTPSAQDLLHTLWSLAPFVPGFALGQHALGDAAEVARLGVDTLMSVALGSHVTFWTEIDRALTPAQRARIRRWTDFYRANRDRLATFAYPLLADPARGGWTALQPWDPDRGRGYLLAWRQGAADPVQRIPLRGVRGSGAFLLTLEDPATGSSTPLGTATADELRAGIEVTIARPFGYAIIRIDSAG
jgi:hypothetical protein